MYNINVISSYSTAPSHKRNKAFNQITSLEPDMITFMAALTIVTILISHYSQMSLDVIHAASQPGRRLVWVAGNRLSKMDKIRLWVKIKSLEKQHSKLIFNVILTICVISVKKTSDEILVARPGSTVTLILRSIVYYRSIQIALGLSIR